MIDLLLIALPLLTAAGCFTIMLDRERKPYTRVFFALMGAAFAWLFVGEFAAQYMGQQLLISRAVRALPFRATAFVATWSFAFAARLRRWWNA